MEQAIQQILTDKLHVAWFSDEQLRNYMSAYDASFDSTNLINL